MNGGAFGENFPYSNFHDLNMDWIIKIAKDFLDQYSHIQETLNNGLEELDNKADELEALLQQWYDTHSGDIANQLADALNDLNAWYTEHQGYLNQYLTDSIAAFNRAADQKAQQTIASIPADYTTLSNDVSDVKSAISANVESIEPFSMEDWEQGTFSSVGAETDSDYRIRLKNNYTAIKDFKVSNTPGYTLNIYKFNSDGSYKSQTGFPSDDTVTEYSIAKGEIINFVLSKYPVALTSTDNYNRINYFGLTKYDKEINNLDDIIIVDNLFTSSDYEQGTFSSVGDPQDSQYRIRLKKNYYAEYDFSITNKPGYTINVFKFNSDGTYNSQTGYPANDDPLTINITKGEFINPVITKYPVALTDISAYSGAVFSNVNKIKILENEIDKFGNEYKINALTNCASFFENADMTYLTHKYYVGAGRQYTTINNALTAWANDGYPHAVVFIANGEYQEKVFVDSGKTIALIGESKDGTIIRTTTGDYTDAPVFIRHGTILLENLTVIADHTGNPSFDYTGETNFAYAFHIDGGSVGNKVIVRNCKAVSYQSAAFGMGLIPGSTIRLEDVEAYCYTASGKRSTGYGCVLCHLADPSLYPSTNAQLLELINVHAYVKNNKSAVTLIQGSSTQTMQITAIGVITASGITDDQSQTVLLPTNYNINNLSSGNTCPAINA